MESPRPRCEAMEVRAAMAPQDNLEGMSFPRLKALAAARGSGKTGGPYSQSEKLSKVFP